VNKKVIVFLDALDPRKTTGFVKDMQQGRYKCNFPCVTPTEMGSILTGKPPGEHGLISPVRLYKPTRQRPIGETVLERVSKRMRVLAWGVPFTANQELERGVAGAGNMDNSGDVPLPALHFPNHGVDMGHVDPPERALHGFMDDASLLFATFRHFIRNDVADAYFIGFRNLDSFTHWFQDGPYYGQLLDHLNAELRATMAMGNDIDLFVFSDHGSTKAHEIFRMNLWFIEKGYLSFRWLEGEHKRKVEHQKKGGNENPYEDQIGPFAPYVEVNDDSMFINDDAFDACINMLKDVPEDVVKKMCSELMETRLFYSVNTREELYPGLTDEQYENLPKVIPHRKEGVLVSSNMMPGLPVTGYTDHEEVLNKRNGDHWPEGYFGSTLKIDDKVEKPEDLFTVMDKFCGEGEEQKETDGYNESDQQEVVNALADLGYM
jgi:hypothetical protein